MSINATECHARIYMSFSEKKDLYVAQCNITPLPELICPGSQQG